MIRTAVTLDLTRRDADADARRRRIFAAAGSCGSGTLVRLVVDADAYWDASMSMIAGMTLDCDVEISGTDLRAVRRYAVLFATFQNQRRAAEAGSLR